MPTMPTFTYAYYAYIYLLYLCSNSIFTYALKWLCVCTHMRYVNIHGQNGNCSLLSYVGCLKNAHYKASPEIHRQKTTHGYSGG